MKRKLVLGSLVAIMAVGCVAEDPTVYFVLANQLVTRKAQCIVKGGSSGSVEAQSVGYMDLLQTNRYLMFPIVQNQLPELEKAVGQNESTMHLDPHTITMTGAWVTYEIAGLQGPYNAGSNGPDGEPISDSTSLPGKVYVPTSGTVAPDNVTTLMMEVIPPEVGTLLDADKGFDVKYNAGMLQTKVVLQGFLGDGTEVHTPPFNFAIKVCRGCLVNYDETASYCCQSSKEVQYVPCWPGQDEASPCRLVCELLHPGMPRAFEKRAMLLGLTGSLADTLSASDLDSVEKSFDDNPEEEEEL